MKRDRWAVLIGGGLVLAACSPSVPPPSSVPPPAKPALHRMLDVPGTPDAVAQCVRDFMVLIRYEADLTTGGTDSAAYLVVRGGAASAVIWEATFRAAGPDRTQIQVWRDDKLAKFELVKELVPACAGKMD